MTLFNYNYAQKLLLRIEKAAALTRLRIAEHGKIELYKWLNIANDITSDLRCIDECIELEIKQDKENDK